MLNYEIDRKVLLPLVPDGTELDDWNGKVFASIVGFMFLDTRVWGVPIPYHRDFEEVNLRFYVRRKAADGWRRGVVFVKELVPKFAVAWIARALYGENYVALPMAHHIGDAEISGRRHVSYSWWFGGKENRIDLTVAGHGNHPAAGSTEEFIAEHYWGYARRKGGGTTEYHVEHPKWRVFPSTETSFDCDVAGLYGEQFAQFFQTPACAFLADGSQVTVYKGTIVSPQDSL